MRSGMWAVSIGALGLAVGVPARVAATTANDLCAATANPCVVSVAVVVTDQSVIDVGARELRITSTGSLNAGTGMMTLRAGTLSVDNGGGVRALGTATTRGGTISVEAGTVTIAGAVDAGGSPGGTINVTATGAFTLSGSMSARSLSRSEIAGSIQISAATASLTGGVSLIGGFDSIGGDFSLDASGAISITSTIDANGGDGGSIDITAGARGGSGSLTISDIAVLRADATTAGGFGGSVDLRSQGDGVSSGTMTMAGLLSVRGLQATIEVGGGSGGCIDLAATGDILINRAGARLVAEGGAPDGDGGEVSLTSERGQIVLQGTISAAVSGPESNAGAASVDAGGDVSITGSITLTGGDGGGGELTVSSQTGSVTVGAQAVLDASSTATGQGGDIAIESGFAAAGQQAVLVQGRIAADGGSGGGSGGSISLTGGDSVRVAPTGTLRVVGTLGGGGGGTVDVAADPGSVSIEGPIVASGASPNGRGGVVSLEGVCGVTVTAAITASGFGGGGLFGVATDTGPIDLRSTVDVRSSAATGGRIEIAGTGDVRIAGTLQTDGATAPGGRIEVTGCEVTVCGLDALRCPAGVTAVLSSNGPGGVNRLTGRESIGVLGTMRANTGSGANELVYDGSAAREPFVAGGSQVNPSARRIVDPTLDPCPICGNGIIEPPETCDDGNMLDGDGCSSCCQDEVPRIAGDANGDGMVTAEDVRFLITEIFDGDGDQVGQVSGGNFRGAPGADVNGDGRITAADLPALLRLLAP